MSVKTLFCGPDLKKRTPGVTNVVWDERTSQGFLNQKTTIIFHKETS